jgi:acyl-CoA synthetase (NDP forming)/GNAT superfamily N-acetyltransferase
MSTTPPTATAIRPVDVELRDGSTARVRQVHLDDAPALAAFLRELSPDALRHRFFGLVDPDAAAATLADTDGADHCGLIATTGTPERVVAHAHYVREPAARVAEAAFAVTDTHRGRGLGTLLLAHLAMQARNCGIDTFEAIVMHANRDMVDMFRASGFPVEVRSGHGEHAVRLPTSLSPEAVEAFERRERAAARAMVRRVLAPRSVAVVGASRRRGTVGGEVLHNLIAGRYRGRVYPVNPNADTVQGMAAFPDVRSLPEAVDLAVIAVPSPSVADAVRDCAARGVRVLVVLSAGFSETGPRGVALQAKVMDICRASGMRLVGPNCLGVLSTDPEMPLNATFATPMPPAGGVAMLTQSGGLGIALAEAARDLGIGVSAFVSVGNKADVSGNDLLNHWEADPRTRVVLLYLESFGNPRRFARVAPRVARAKPIVAMKGGRSAAGARAAASHTGALVAASDVTVGALITQAGVIRAGTMREMFDITRLLASQPVPEGRRVGIVTNAGGPGILCADACEDQDLEVVGLPPRVRSRLAESAAAEASVGNPVDLLAAAGPDEFARAVRELAGSGAVDSLVVIYIEPGLGGRGPEVAHAVGRAMNGRRALPYALVLMSSDDRAAVRADPPPGDPPVYDYPEAAARALGHAVRYGRWRSRPPGAVPHHADADPARAAAILSRAGLGGREWLAAADLSELLGAYGLPLIESHEVADVDGAARAAARVGGPVALKAIAPGLVHKSEFGAVQLGLSGAGAVRAAASRMAERLREVGLEPSGYLVQPMAPGGVEMLVGATTDPQFGPVVVCGAGGTEAEVRRDVAVRLTPLSDTEAASMVRELRMLPLLEGYRGSPGCDIAAVEDLVLRLAAMVHAHPQILEIDCNPVSVSPDGVLILDARVRIGPAAAPTPWPSLRAIPPVG